MAAALKGLKFEVVEGLDLDKRTMEITIRKFAQALKNADVALFFYAGHGLQVNGQNYLVPIDARLEDATGLDFEMIRLDLVHRAMERETRANLIFLDACRDNPLSRNLARAMGTRSGEIGHGLAPVESGVGTLISFSTQPGNVALDGEGRNSPFASALAKRIRTEGEDLSSILIGVRNDVMEATRNRQIPWEHSALRSKFFFSAPRRLFRRRRPAPRPKSSWPTGTPRRPAATSARSDPISSAIRTAPMRIGDADDRQAASGGGVARGPRGPRGGASQGRRREEGKPRMPNAPRSLPRSATRCARRRRRCAPRRNDWRHCGPPQRRAKATEAAKSCTTTGFCSAGAGRELATRLLNQSHPQALLPTPQPWRARSRRSSSASVATPGSADGVWGTQAKEALAKFARLAKVSLSSRRANP